MPPFLEWFWPEGRLVLQKFQMVTLGHQKSLSFFYSSISAPEIIGNHIGGLCAYFQQVWTKGHA